MQFDGLSHGEIAIEFRVLISKVKCRQNESDELLVR